MTAWFEAMTALGLDRGVSFHLDFHTIPFHGEDALIEKHYVSKRSRRQKGVLAFLSQGAERRVFCYANAEIRKADQNDEILRFIRFWQARNKLNEMGIRFITLRRRTDKLLAALDDAPALPGGASSSRASPEPTAPPSANDYARKALVSKNVKALLDNPDFVLESRRARKRRRNGGISYGARDGIGVD